MQINSKLEFENKTKQKRRKVFLKFIHIACPQMITTFDNNNNVKHDKRKIEIKKSEERKKI